MLWKRGSVLPLPSMLPDGKKKKKSEDGSWAGAAISRHEGGTTCQGWQRNVVEVAKVGVPSRHQSSPDYRHCGGCFCSQARLLSNTPHLTGLLWRRNETRSRKTLTGSLTQSRWAPRTWALRAERLQQGMPLLGRPWPSRLHLLSTVSLCDQAHSAARDLCRMGTRLILPMQTEPRDPCGGRHPGLSTANRASPTRLCRFQETLLKVY